MQILVDLDGVLADFEAAARHELSDTHPDIAALLPPADAQPTFHLAAALPEQHRGPLWDIICRPGFYRDLPVVDGGPQALEGMRDRGWQVHLCTSPLLTNPTCTSDKLAWIGQHLGEDWLARTVITKDKTLVRGDVLIDDKPAITGAHTPTWTHVLYDRPYNASSDRPRLTWATWADVLSGLR